MLEPSLAPWTLTRAETVTTCPMRRQQQLQANPFTLCRPKRSEAHRQAVVQFACCAATTWLAPRVGIAGALSRAICNDSGSSWAV